MPKQTFSIWFTWSLVLVLVAPVSPAAGVSNPVQKGEMAGYLLVPNEKVPETFNAGFSMYVAAWPLLDQYPGQSFQTGLFGTWMIARKDPPPPIKLYTGIEGGLGWWRDTEYATETPKFIMGGVAPNFSEWANGPGAGQGRDWDKPNGLSGVKGAGKFFAGKENAETKRPTPGSSTRAPIRRNGRKCGLSRHRPGVSRVLRSQ
jgi:hypothetical protein